MALVRAMPAPGGTGTAVALLGTLGLLLLGAAAADGALDRPFGDLGARPAIRLASSRGDEPGEVGGRSDALSDRRPTGASGRSAAPGLSGPRWRAGRARA
jgi:hypothetical protein